MSVLTGGPAEVEKRPARLDSGNSRGTGGIGLGFGAEAAGEGLLIRYGWILKVL